MFGQRKHPLFQCFQLLVEQGLKLNLKIMVHVLVIYNLPVVLLSTGGGSIIVVGPSGGFFGLLTSGSFLVVIPAFTTKNNVTIFILKTTRN